MRHRKHLLLAIVFLAVVGFADATYLTAKHYLGGPLTCVLFTGCNAVASSPYSVVGGIPLSLLGSVFYLAVIIITGLYLDLKKIIFLRLLTILAAGAVIESVFLTLLQALVIKAYCVYCLFSAGIATAIFILLILSLPPRRRASGPQSHRQSI